MNFIRNAWYPASLSQFVTTKPQREVVLGTPVVLYRTESGQVAALNDRCPHRFVTLHTGMVIGEELECPYHGLRFNTLGTCTLNPHGDRKIPAAARVDAYPIVERHGVVWIWPGEPARADASRITDLSGFLGNGEWPVVGDVLDVKANAGLVLDNIMDVSHAPFIHRTSFSDAGDIATLKFELKQEGNTVWSNNYVPNARVSALFEKFWQSAATRCDTIAHMRWDAPFTAQLELAVSECGQPPQTGLRMHVVHLLRPINDTTTRYFWLLGRNFAMDVEQVSRIIREKINHGFTTEDEPAIAACAENMGTTDLMSLKPVLLPGDAAAIRTRRILEQMYRAETMAEAAA